MENEENQEVELEEQNDEEQEVEEVEEPQEEVEEEKSVEDETDWKAEALKYKAIANRKTKKKINSNINSNLQDKAQNPDDLRSDVEYLKLEAKKRQFQFEHNLTPSQVDKVFSVNQNPDKDTLKDPFIKAGLKGIERQERVNNNTPQTSAKSKTLDRKAMKDMSPEDKQVAYQKYMESKK